MRLVERRTVPLNRQVLLDEVGYVNRRLKDDGLSEAAVSFGWDCNLSLTKCGRTESVPVEGAVAFLHQAEKRGIGAVGKCDIFVASPGFCLTLCHEGYAHVDGISELILEMLRRWLQFDYAPYRFQQRPQV